jgi:hypothetical protein
MLQMAPKKEKNSLLLLESALLLPVGKVAYFIKMTDVVEFD